jgi:hypothetical protein
VCDGRRGGSSGSMSGEEQQGKLAAAEQCCVQAAEEHALGATCLDDTMTTLIGIRQLFMNALGLHWHGQLVTPQHVAGFDCQSPC